MIELERISALEKIGCKRWTKGNHDRIYISAKVLGLSCKYYNSGNISYAELNGERTSNSYARKLHDANTYIDVKTGKIYGSNNELKEAAEALLINLI